MVRKVVLIALALAAAPPAFAKQKFLAFEGDEQIARGTGGTRVTKDGVDFWTTGTPARRYKVIGVINDKRGDGWFSREVAGSPAIAKLVKKNGGDAVIMGEAREQNNGYVFAGNAAIAVRKNLTQMLVVKYLE